MKRSMTFGLFANGMTIDKSNDKNRWNDPTYKAMYPGCTVVAVAVYK